MLAALTVAAASLGSVAVVATSAGASPLTESPNTPTVDLNITGGAAATDNLEAGDVISFDVTSTGGTTLNNIETRLCKTGFTSYSASTFGTSGSAGTRCVQEFGTPPFGITGGNYLNPNPGTTYRIDLASLTPGSTSTPTQNFTVGTGHAEWLPAGGVPQTLDCDATHPCDMVVQVNSTAGTTYFIQTLTYLAAPDSPTFSSVVEGNGQVTLGWTPAATGGPADDYQVTVSPVPGSGVCSTGTCPLTAGTSLLVDGLANFTTYTFDIVAINNVGTSTPPDTTTGTPGPTGPTNLTATPGDTTVDLSWSTADGAPNYQVNVYAGPCPPAGSPIQTLGPIAGGSTTVTGLTNSTDYCFTVRGDYGGGDYSPVEASAVAGSSPGAAVIYQTINVTRPTGVLVISQRCAAEPGSEFGPFDASLPDFQDGGATGDYDPSNAGALLTPATRCVVDLSGPRASHIVAGVTTAQQRTVYDADVTAGSVDVFSPTAGFATSDIGQLVTGDGIPAGTRILDVVNPSWAVLTGPATATFDDGVFAVLGRTITAPAGAFSPVDNGKSLQGLEIPGGTNIVYASAFTGSLSLADLDQTANHANTGQDVKVWDEAATPARLLTSGPNTGAYLQATGKISQVYVVDYRDSDTAGWTASGIVDQFCDGSNDFDGAPGDPSAPADGEPGLAPDPCTIGDNAFSSVNLGWEPKVRFQSGAPGFTVGAGAFVLPVTGGLDVSRTLASTTGSTGLGVARLDADLNLLIPVTVDGGFYQATLQLDVA